MRAVGGATSNGMGRDRSGGGSRRFASDLLVVGSCPGSAAECANAAAESDGFTFKKIRDLILGEDV